MRSSDVRMIYLALQYTVNPLLSLPGAYLFQGHLRGGGGVDRGVDREGGLFYLAKKKKKKKRGRYRLELRFPTSCFGPGQ